MGETLQSYAELMGFDAMAEVHRTALDLLRAEGAGIGIVRQLGTWRVKIHRTDCPHYLRSADHSRRLEVSPGMAITACRYCCHRDDDFMALAVKLLRVKAKTHGGVGELCSESPLKSSRQLRTAP